MANASKNKGKSWEREVAKHLTSIYGVNFQRVPNSGAFVGGFNAHRSTNLTPEQLLLASGDIILPAFLSHLSLECKFYKDINFESLLSQCTKLEDWLEQACAGDKIPLVIFKINRKGGFVVFPYDLKDRLRIEQNHLVYAVTDTKKKTAGMYVVVKMEGFFERNVNELVALNENNLKIWATEYATRALLSNGVRTLSG